MGRAERRIECAPPPPRLFKNINVRKPHVGAFETTEKHFDTANEEKP